MQFGAGAGAVLGRCLGCRWRREGAFLARLNALGRVSEAVRVACNDHAKSLTCGVNGTSTVSRKVKL